MNFDIDEKYFYKEKALKNITLIGKIFFYTGAAVPYLDYQTWFLYLRWWHPLTWIALLLDLIIFVIYGIKEGINNHWRTIFPPKEYKKYNYYKAK
jgi:hypothetical protein